MPDDLEDRLNQWQNALKFLSKVTNVKVYLETSSAETADPSTAFQNAKRANHNLVARLTPQLLETNQPLIKEQFISGNPAVREALAEGLLQAEPPKVKDILPEILSAIKRRDPYLPQLLKIAHREGDENCGRALNDLLLNGTVTLDEVRPVFEAIRQQSPGLQFLNSLSEISRGTGTQGDAPPPQRFLDLLYAGCAPDSWVSLINSYVQASPEAASGVLEACRKSLNKATTSPAGLLPCITALCLLSHEESDVDLASRRFWKIPHGTEEFLRLVGEPVSSILIESGLKSPASASRALKVLAKRPGAERISQETLCLLIEQSSKPDDLYTALSLLMRQKTDEATIVRGTAKLAALLKGKPAKWEKKFSSAVARAYPRAFTLGLKVASPEVRKHMLSCIRLDNGTVEDRLLIALLSSLGPEKEIIREILNSTESLGEESSLCLARLAMVYPAVWEALGKRLQTTVLSQAAANLNRLFDRDMWKNALLESFHNIDPETAWNQAVEFAENQIDLVIRLFLQAAERVFPDRIESLLDKGLLGSLVLSAIKEDLPRKTQVLKEAASAFGSTVSQLKQGVLDAKTLLENSATAFHDDGLHSLLASTAEHLGQAAEALEKEQVGPSLHTFSFDLNNSTDPVYQWFNLVRNLYIVQSEQSVLEQRLLGQIAKTISPELENMCVYADGYKNVPLEVRTILDTLVRKLHLSWVSTVEVDRFDPARQILAGSVKAPEGARVRIIYPGLMTPEGIVLSRSLVKLA